MALKSQTKKQASSREDVFGSKEDTGMANDWMGRMEAHVPNVLVLLRR